MKQSIPGVSPSQVRETTSQVVWPSNAAYASGRWLGRLYEIQGPFGGRVFTLGNLIALASIPHALALYFYKLLPWRGVYYVLTNRRVIIFRGRVGVEEKSVALDHFNHIEIEVRPGQAWYHAGDLIFYDGDVEVLRLEGVARPEAFRSSCMKAHMSYVGVKQAMAREAAMA